MASPRDADRARVYSAEHQVHGLFDSADASGVRTLEVFGSTLTLPIERRFAALASVQTYLDRVLALNWVQAAYPSAGPVTVRARAGQRQAHYEPVPATIALPLHAGNQAWALREFVVLHELAHHLAPDGLRHGTGFVAAYLHLVAEIIGPEAGLVLRIALHENGRSAGRATP